MEYVTKDEMEAVLRRPLSGEQWVQMQGLLRRAARELELLVGDLTQYDPELVGDTLADAIREEWVNPDRLKQEMDSSYSYTKAELPDGQEGRFWWPSNLLALFGVEQPKGGRLRVIRVGVSPAMHGWIR